MPTTPHGRGMIFLNNEQQQHYRPPFFPLHKHQFKNCLRLYLLLPIYTAFKFGIFPILSTWSFISDPNGQHTITFPTSFLVAEFTWFNKRRTGIQIWNGSDLPYPIGNTAKQSCPAIMQFKILCCSGFISSIPNCGIILLVAARISVDVAILLVSPNYVTETTAHWTKRNLGIYFHWSAKGCDLILILTSDENFNGMLLDLTRDK